MQLLTALSLCTLIVLPAAARLNVRSHGPFARSHFLEARHVFEARYAALGCENRQSDVDFFETCCHQLQVGVQANPACEARPAPRKRARCKTKPTSAAPSSTKPAPKPTTHKSPIEITSKPKPKPTTTPTERKTTAKPKPTSSSNDLSGLITGGFATFFTQNGVAGACGTVHKDSDLICAMDSRRYGNTSVKSSLCGKQVLIRNKSNGKTVTVTVADACPTCENNNSIDLSTGAFNMISEPEIGEVSIEWKFV